MAPDRLQLQNMLKKNFETFKEYAQRWRELATQVEPPLNDKQLVTMFMGTLQSRFMNICWAVFLPTLLILSSLEKELNLG